MNGKGKWNSRLFGQQKRATGEAIGGGEGRFKTSTKVSLKEVVRKAKFSEDVWVSQWALIKKKK